MKIEEIKDLMAYLEKSGLKKIHIKRGDFELSLEKESAMMAPPQPIFTHIQNKEDLKGSKEEKKEEKFVTSPMVGTLYLAAGTGQAPFVKVGQAVEESTVVCIIEAMKVMNEIKAGKKGVIGEILCSNAQPCEFGTRLFRVE